MDLAFAISAMPRDSNFDLILDVVKEITQRFFSNRVRYGLIVFGKDAAIKIQFTEKHTDLSILQMYIGSIESNTDDPALDKALVLAKTMLESEPTRTDARKVRTCYLFRNICFSDTYLFYCCPLFSWVRCFYAFVSNIFLPRPSVDLIKTYPFYYCLVT